MSLANPQCSDCVHFRLAGVLSCDAFPGGIPDEILLAEWDHSKPIAGDHGIQYEPRDAELTAERK
jgi:hypothetical protein